MGLQEYTDELNDLQKQILLLWTEPEAEGKIEAVEHRRRDIMQKIKILQQHPYPITQQRDGRWITYYRSKEKGSVRKQIHRKTKEEVEEVLIALYKEEESDQRSYTIKELFTEWVQDLEMRGQRATAVRYIYDYDKYLKAAEIVEKDIREIKASEIMTALIDTVNAHEQTIRKYRDLKSIFNGIFDYAIERDIVDINRARQIKRVRQDAFAPARTKTDAEQIFSEEEQAAFVNACFDLYFVRGNPAYLAVVLNFLLGVRAGELCCLKLTDFDFKRHKLLVQRSEVKQRRVNKDGTATSAGVQVVSHLKAGKNERRIDIDESVTEEFVRYIIEQTEAAGGNCDEWLFTRRDGSRMTEANIMHAMQNARKRSGLTGKTNHNIRKTVITRLIQSKLFSTTDIMRQAGHSSFETTQRYYAFAIDDSEKAKNLTKTLASTGIKFPPSKKANENPGKPVKSSISGDSLTSR